MTNLLFFTPLLLVILISCEDDKAVTRFRSEFPKRLLLVEEIGSTPNSILKGPSPTDSEEYLLNADSTFVKLMIISSNSTVASGTYSYKNINGTLFLVFTYIPTEQAAQTGIIQSCSPGEEYFLPTADGATNTFDECDGPTLIFNWK